MNIRVKISAILLMLGLILALLPLSGKYSLHEKPEKVLSVTLNPDSYLSPDQMAKAVVTGDSSIQIFDLRSSEEFSDSSLPGAVNLPYGEFLAADLESYLNHGLKNVFYSNDDFDANYALVLATGIGYENCFVMQGGLKAWQNDIMNSEFTGERISARENALFETRFKARKMFNELNSLPDSLKLKYRASLEIERKKLDGGCE